MSDESAPTLSFRPATRSDLPGVLRLYAQPDLDDGSVLPVADAERILERMSSYPNYKVYVTLREDRVVGTFALLIMDNLGHLGAPSAIIEDVAVDPSLAGAGDRPVDDPSRHPARRRAWVLQGRVVVESEA